MKYLTPDKYGDRLTELPDEHVSNWITAAIVTTDDPEAWLRAAVRAEAEGQGRQDRIAALNQALASV